MHAYHRCGICMTIVVVYCLRKLRVNLNMYVDSFIKKNTRLFLWVLSALDISMSNCIYVAYSFIFITHSTFTYTFLIHYIHIHYIHMCTYTRSLFHLISYYSYCYLSLCILNSHSPPLIVCMSSWSRNNG